MACKLSGGVWGTLIILNLILHILTPLSSAAWATHSWLLTNIQNSSCRISWKLLLLSMQTSGHTGFFFFFSSGCDACVFSSFGSWPHPTLTTWWIPTYPLICLILMCQRLFCLILSFILNNNPIKQVWLWNSILHRNWGTRMPHHFPLSHSEDGLSQLWIQFCVTPELRYLTTIAGCFSEMDVWGKCLWGRRQEREDTLENTYKWETNKQNKVYS